MKFGIFYALQLPRPWHADSEFGLRRSPHAGIRTPQESNSTALQARYGAKSVQLKPAS